jgi:hypothetical protein
MHADTRRPAHDSIALVSTLAPPLLVEALGVAVPHYAESRVESSDLTDVLPAEYRADVVVLLVDGKPVLGIVVEVQ